MEYSGKMNDTISNTHGKLFFFSNETYFEGADLVDIYPDKSKAYIFLVVSAILAIFVYLLAGRINEKTNRLLLLISVIVGHTGLYIKNLGYIDEVYVNLIHPFNLHQHGRFSFRSDILVDGTVEYLYYVLLTPFSANRVSLLLAAFTLGWFIATMHFIIIERIFRNEITVVYATGMALTLFHSELNRILAEGFGNGLVSLAFLAGIWAWRESRPSVMIVISVMLPLIRIDAILYSSVLLLFCFLEFGNFKRIISGFAISLLSMLLVLLFSKMYYGHYIPTPIAFKSVPFRLVIANLNRFPYAILLNSLSVPGLILLPILIAIFKMKLMESSFRNLIILYVLLLFISGVYYIQARVNSPDRYYLPMYFVANICIGLAIGRFIRELITSVSCKISGTGLQKIVIMILILVNSHLAFQSRRFAFSGKDFLLPLPFDGLVSRTFKIANEAVVLNEILTESQRVATTELNTLGFFANFKIDPLWGYANREIARSKTHVKFSGGIRVLPNYVIRSKPDYLWVYHVPQPVQNFIFNSDKDGSWYDFGVMVGIASVADLASEFPNVVLISRGNCDICLLVPERSMDLLKSRLMEAGYKSCFERPLNLKAIQDSNRRHPMVLKTY